jgi:hypothetical protein
MDSGKMTDEELEKFRRFGVTSYREAVMGHIGFLQQERYRLRDALVDALTDSMYSESKRIEKALKILA